MQKPDMRAMREAVTLPLYMSGDGRLDSQSRSRVGFLGRCIKTLCDYIDSLDNAPISYDAAAFQRLEELHTKKLREIRKYVAGLPGYVMTSRVASVPCDFRDKVLDFIDNGPKKLTAREVISAVLRDTGTAMVGETSFEIDAALRTAGLLKE